MMGLDAAGTGYTPEIVAQYLYRAGETLMTLQVSGLRPAPIRSGMPLPVDAVGHDRRLAPPSARRISEMDQVLTWIKLVPEGRMRAVVNARCLCLPTADGPRPLFSWRQIGDVLRTSPTSVRTWWYDGASVIAAALNRPLYCQSPGIAGTKGLVPLARPQRVTRSKQRARDIVAA